MKNMIPKTQRNFYLTVVLLFAFLFSHVLTSSAQDAIPFDHPDKKKFIATVINENGQDKLINGYGETSYGEEYLSMSLQERIERGLTFAVTSQGVNQPEERSNEGGVRFNITYKEVIIGSGTGFDDPTLGEQRRNALNAVFHYFSTIINNTGTADVQIDPSSFENITQSYKPPLATSMTVTSASKGFNDCLAFRHLNTGTDPSSVYSDIMLSFNFGSNINYNYDHNTSPSSSQYDFFTVAAHEILHGLGISSYMAADGTSEAIDNVFTAFDEFLLNPSYSPLLVASGSGSGLTVAIPEVSYLTSNQLYFDNLNGVNTPLYSPVTFSASSLDHFDNERSVTGNCMMNFSLAKGDYYRELHPEEANALVRLGYDINVSLATSVQDNTSVSADSRIYPNPASSGEGVKINLQGVNNPEILVVVYDMLGRVSYSKVVMNKGSGPLTAIDPHNNLAPGMYIVIGSSKNELFNQKLVIE